MSGEQEQPKDSSNPYQAPRRDDPPVAAVATPGRSYLGENQLIWVLWATYGAFYFCRTNISVALPGIESELGFTKVEMGVVLSALKFSYAAGQFFNGQLAERISPRMMLAIGMFGSAAMNVVFGMGASVYFFLFVWAINGYCQSLGWTPCMRVVGNWIPVHRRGNAIGVIGTGYQLTAVLAYIVPALAFDWTGAWQAVFYVPAVILVVAGVAMLLLLREYPNDERRAQIEARNRAKDGAGKSTGGWVANLMLTLSNPALWLLAIALGLVNACRYGFVDWGISHLVDIEKERGASDVLQSGDVLKSAVKYAVLPAGAIAGSYLSGWATDRFFNSRRAPVMCVLLVALSILTVFYHPIAQSSLPGTLVVLGAIGFCIYGPQVLLVGTAPADLAKAGTPAAAAGFVNCAGYVGAALGDIATGHIVDRYDWQTAIYVWAGWALAAALVVGLLWNATGDDT